jgi:alpha-1,6-mannosyltransferase
VSVRGIIFFGVFLEALYLSLFLSNGLLAQIATFIAVNAMAYFLLAYFIYKNRTMGENANRDARRLWLIVGFAILFRLSLIPHSPVATDDIYRYVWDGKVAAAGINPFRYAPTDPQLAFLQSADLSAKINFPNMRTIYPPLAQGLFLASSLLFGDSVIGLKLLLVLCDLATIFLLLRLLARFNRDPETIVLYAWSPLPIMYFALDGHIDALGIPFLLLFLNFLCTSRNVRSAISLALGGLAKLYPLFLLPLLLKKRPRFEWIRLPGIVVFIVAGGYLLYWGRSSGGTFESLAIFNSTFAFNGLFYSVLREILPSAATTHLSCAVLFATCLAGIFFMKRSVPEKVFLTFFCFALLSPVVHPWYLTWLAALLVLRWSVAVFTLLGLSNISNLVVYWHRQTGIWENKPWLLSLEYLPFLILLVWELVQGRFSHGQTIPATVE